MCDVDLCRLMYNFQTGRNQSHLNQGKGVFHVVASGINVCQKSENFLFMSVIHFWTKYFNQMKELVVAWTSGS